MKLSERRCERCGQRIEDLGDAGYEFDLDICCNECAIELEIITEEQEQAIGGN